MIRTVEIDSLQPSALYLNQKDVGEWLMSGCSEEELSREPFPAIIINKRIILIDQHPRPFLAAQTGCHYIQIDIQTEFEGTEGYRKMAQKCRDHGITKLTDLTKQMLSPEDYQRGWLNEIPSFFSRA